MGLCREAQKGSRVRWATEASLFRGVRSPRRTCSPLQQQQQTDRLACGKGPADTASSIPEVPVRQRRRGGLLRTNPGCPTPEPDGPGGGCLPASLVGRPPLPADLHGHETPGWADQSPGTSLQKKRFSTSQGACCPHQPPCGRPSVHATCTHGARPLGDLLPAPGPASGTKQATGATSSAYSRPQGRPCPQGHSAPGSSGPFASRRNLSFLLPHRNPQRGWDTPWLLPCPRLATPHAFRLPCAPRAGAVQPCCPLPSLSRPPLR